VVLGGGLAGLYAAYGLATAGRRVIVIEREFEPGGILRGHSLGSHRFSLAEAPLATTDSKLAEDLIGLFSSGLVTAGTPPPPPRLRWNGGDLAVPIRFKDLIQGLAPAIRGDLVLSQLTAGFRRGSATSPRDAAEVIRSRFGAPLCQLVIQPDLERYWGQTLKDLAPAAADLPMRAFLATAPPPSDAPPVWTVGTGPDLVAARLAHAVQALGGKIFYGAEVEEVVLGEGEDHQVVIRDLLSPEGEAPSRIAISSQGVLSTIPLRGLIRALGNRVPAQIHASSYYLTHLPIQAYACLIRKERCLDHLTIHFRDRPFLRISEPNYFSATRQIDDDSTLIVIEVPGRAPQHSSDGWQTILEALESERICQRGEILATQLLHAPGGHPILRKDGEAHLQRIQDCLSRFPDLALAGACGRFTYASPAEAMISGRAAAATLTERSA